MEDKKKPKVIDLFCGIGGFTKGFERAGFDIVLGIDNWSVALKTFKKNHGDSQTLNRDIKEIEDKFYQNYAGKIDVIVTGPPCQGFSMAGRRDINDKRNTLFEEVVRAVGIIKPKVVVIENVVGLLSMKNPEEEYVRDLIKDKLGELGYSVKHKILDASDYGVPQARKRVIFIGSRAGDIVFPNPNNSIVDVQDAFGNIPDFPAEFYDKPKTKFQKEMANGITEIHNHQPMKHNIAVLNRIKNVPQGGNWQDIPKEVYNVGGFHSNNYRRLDPKKPSITIKHATKSMIIHPSFDRVITVREAARLQSFPDSFILSGTVSEQHQQLANAVPPLLGQAIAEEIAKRLNGSGS